MTGPSVSWGRALLVAGLLLGGCGPLVAASSSVYSFFTFPKLLCLSAGALLSWVGLAVLPREGPSGRWPLAAPAAACGAALLASSLLSRDPALSLAGDLRLCAYGTLQLGLLAALHYAAAAARPWVSVRLVIGSTLGVAAALAAYGLAQKGGVHLIAGLAHALPEGRITGLQGSPVFLGACLMAALPGAFLFARSPSRAERWLGWTSGALVGAALWLTYSRAAWLGAATAWAAWAVFRSRTGPAGAGAPAGPGAGRPGLRSWQAAAVAAFLVAAGLAGWLASRSQRQGLSHSDLSRVQLWRASLRVFAEDPWLGSGPDTWEGALGPLKDDAFLGTLGLRVMENHAHNDWLQALATTGLLGLAAYLWLQWALFRAARASLARAPGREAAALASALLALFVQMKVNPAPLASLAVAAVFSGFLLPEPAPAPRLPSALLCLPLAAAAWLSLGFYRADAAYLRAFKALRSGRPAEALREFGAAARLNPTSTRYWLGKADAAHALARTERDPEKGRAFLQEAVASARAAAAWRPGAAEAHNLLGVSLLRLGQAGRPEALAEAEEVLERALTLDRGSTVLLSNAQLAARLRGRSDREAAFGAELARLRRLGER